MVVNAGCDKQIHLCVCAVNWAVHSCSCCSHSSSHRSIASCQNRDFYLPHLDSTPLLGGSRRNIAMTFGVEKLEWSDKILKICAFVSTECTNVTDRQTGMTDKRTRHGGIGRACIASRGNSTVVQWQALQKRGRPIALRMWAILGLLPDESSFYSAHCITKTCYMLT